ncbi:ATP-binding cassette domain-containing protein [Halocynthiibacter sp. C4]|uniref:ATP-binding cassette domain-containing protein n=1 Tax=Halocynthiibacter sp. C4 TaxID=2992758 RepID=UPI00237B12EC|nr:ATP-binding cassette domain-containing protein [Halocynthiibacter sp. C4]MDE0588870.1 ATP-binding cassette domain-containing protein [Halocynthiibacter sp. C4]
MVNSILPLELQEVVVAKRGRRIVGPVTYTLAGAGTTIVIGPNGSGKTTLLRMMHGLERTSEGRLRWAQAFNAASERQSFVFQSPIIMRRSVLDNLAYPLTLAGKSRKEANEAAARWAAKVGLASRLQQNASRLSGGEKQKLALARALIREPDVLFLDEPCANLDGKATRVIEGVLQDAKSNGTRLVMSTHDMGQARRLADDVIFMLGGQIHECAPAQDFFNSPATPETEQFLRGDIVE